MLDAAPVGPPKVHCLGYAGARVAITILTFGLEIYLFVEWASYFDVTEIRSCTHM